MNHTHCLRCGRPLTSAASTRRGYGPTCAARIRAAAQAADLADYSAAQVDAARELIEDGGVLALGRRVYRTVSTDGTELHLTAPQACNCKAGLKGIRCYHTAAARLLLAA